ncbi:MAG: hypothetical protein ACQKBY_00665, partial [Verrucomicrobiales bacterium]
ELAASGTELPVHSRKRLARRHQRRRWQKIALLGSLGLLALGGLTFLALKRPAPEPEVAQTLSEEATAETLELKTLAGDESENAPHRLAETWELARELLAQKDYAAAEKHFLELMADPESKEPTASWAGLEAIIAAQLDGRSNDADKLARQLEKRLDGMRKKPPILNTLHELTRTLTSPRPTAHPAPRAKPHDIAQLMSGFALSLQNWESGHSKAAVVWLGEFAKHKENKDFPWLGIYRSLAADYLADARLLAESDWKQAPDEPEANRMALEKLDGAYAFLKTKGRARYNIRARQIWLARHLKYLEAHPEGLPRASSELLAAARRQAEKGEFALAAYELSRPRLDDDSQLSINAWRCLYEGASASLTEAGAAEGDPGALSAHLGALETRVSESSTAWESHRLREQALCLYWLGGQQERAKKLAGELAADNPDFHNRWEKLAPHLTQ